MIFESLDLRRLLASNVIVSDAAGIHEYSPSGVLVRELPIPEDAVVQRAVIQDLQVSGNKLWVFEGETFRDRPPTLMSFDISTGRWASRTHTPWSLAGSLVNGNVGIVGDYVFADSGEVNGATGNGILRFDTRTGEVTATGGNVAFGDMTVGLDGLVYALDSTLYTYADDVYGTKVYVFDPYTMASVRTLELFSVASTHSAICVDADGSLFAAAIRSDTIYHYDAAGNVLQTARQAWPHSPLDLEINSAGEIAIGLRGGKVALTDRTLSSFHFIDVPTAYYGNRVAFGTLGSLGTGVGQFPALRGTVYHDLDMDGIQDLGDPGLPGRVVFIDSDRDLLFDATEPYTKTNGNGRYAFEGFLTPTATYEVRQVLRDNMVMTTDQSEQVSMPQLGTRFVHFGNIATIEVRGSAFFDLNRNRQQGSGEAGFGRVWVYADLDNDGRQDLTEPTVRTNKDGNFTLRLRPGYYALRSQIPTGWQLTTQPRFSFKLTTAGTGRKRFGFATI